MQRFDLKTLRYDKFTHSVLVNMRTALVEIPVEALETYNDRKLSPEEALGEVAENAKLLSQLAGRIPSDDGKIVLTTNLIQNDAVFASLSKG